MPRAQTRSCSDITVQKCSEVHWPLTSVSVTCLISPTPRVCVCVCVLLHLFGLYMSWLVMCGCPHLRYHLNFQHMLCLFPEQLPLRPQVSQLFLHKEFTLPARPYPPPLPPCHLQSTRVLTSCSSSFLHGLDKF